MQMAAFQLRQKEFQWQRAVKPKRFLTLNSSNGRCRIGLLLPTSSLELRLMQEFSSWELRVLARHGPTLLLFLTWRFSRVENFSTNSGGISLKGIYIWVTTWKRSSNWPLILPINVTYLTLVSCLTLAFLIEYLGVQLLEGLCYSLRIILCQKLVLDLINLYLKELTKGTCARKVVDSSAMVILWSQCSLLLGQELLQHLLHPFSSPVQCIQLVIFI